jgi:hypothetical protein
MSIAYFRIVVNVMPYQGASMPIQKLLQEQNFLPEDVARLVAAYEDCLQKLALTDRSDPMTHLVAKLIVNAAREGVRDPDALSAAVMKRLAK